MKIFLISIQIFVSVLLIFTILMQARGTGLGSTWGGGGESYRSKRGVEKMLFVSTVILALFFLVFAIINLSV